LLTLVVMQDAPRRALEILELSAAERPQERRESKQTQKQRARDEPGQSGHCPILSRIEESLTALAVTAIDDADMAIAASSGVTRPITANGTKMQL
jgi:hypothetical protein